MLSVVPSVLSYAPTLAPAHATLPMRTSSPLMETKADLQALAKELNPVLGFYDPLNLAGADFWGKGDEATIGWLRHAEIKHGRVAMMAFVGYTVQAQGFSFPWACSSAKTFAEISAAGSPADQWDALPTYGKLQILAAIGLFEYFGENSDALAAEGEKHYTKGGKPGFYPSLKSQGVPHPVPFDLFDPVGWSKNASPETKARGLVAEINNGRLAMIGIMGFLCQSKGLTVPALANFIEPYSGQYMAPFSMNDAQLPMVEGMLKSFDGGSWIGLGPL